MPISSRQWLRLANGFSTSFLKNCVIWRFISTPTPRSRRSWKYLWKFFASFSFHDMHPTTLGLFQMQLESVLNTLYQEQPSRCVLMKMCSKNMHAANFIYRRTPTQKCIYWTHTSTCVFSCKFAAYFQNPFPKNTSRRLLLLYSPLPNSPTSK